ncbi:MAG: hypothetical protein U9O94_05960 [Nanoarchaeota archaeon]|nr:hypothetical protein [Nanoarchaeota archaeon]
MLNDNNNNITISWDYWGAIWKITAKVVYHSELKIVSVQNIKAIDLDGDEVPIECMSSNIQMKDTVKDEIEECLVESLVLQGVIADPSRLSGDFQNEHKWYVQSEEK